jgi:hypothetical protein
MTTTFARVDPETLEVTLKYNTNGADRWSPDDLPCEIPFDVLADQAVKDPETGNVTLLEDPAKVTQKTQAQWTSVRAQQKQKLYESDWTCSVTDYEVPNKSEWVQYRAALRDVTRGSAPPGTEGSLSQADPFAIEWPVAPV